MSTPTSELKLLEGLLAERRQLEDAQAELDRQQNAINERKLRVAYQLRECESELWGLAHAVEIVAAYEDIRK